MIRLLRADNVGPFNRLIFFELIGFARAEAEVEAPALVLELLLLLLAGEAAAGA